MMMIESKQRQLGDGTGMSVRACEVGERWIKLELAHTSIFNKLFINHHWRCPDRHQTNLINGIVHLVALSCHAWIAFIFIHCSFSSPSFSSPLASSLCMQYAQRIRSFTYLIRKGVRAWRDTCVWVRKPLSCVAHRTRVTLASEVHHHQRSFLLCDGHPSFCC